VSHVSLASSSSRGTRLELVEQEAQPDARNLFQQNRIGPRLKVSASKSGGFWAAANLGRQSGSRLERRDCDETGAATNQ
jgi:hypothetical protein